MKILETERLYLREMTINDAENMYLLNLDLNVLQYTGDVPFESIENAKKFLKNYDHYKKYNFGRWAVIHKTTDEFLGWCGLKYTPELDEYDIGFRFLKKHWNKGFATESAKACLNLGFDKYHITEIIGRAMVENIGSIKVLEKIGFAFHKTFNFDGEKGLIYKSINKSRLQNNGCI
ncbi:MAG: GNAT family N-acetyltransferase [Bacteroidetes bacterium]|nr:GNAT family N-acetyltransferase [Bacteroidota bacterium]